MGKEKPNKLVALCYDISGGCQYVALVKNITPSEYATLLGECREHEQERTREKRELLDRIETLEENCKTLAKEIKVLKGEDEDEEIIED